VLHEDFGRMVRNRTIMDAAVLSGGGCMDWNVLVVSGGGDTKSSELVMRVVRVDGGTAVIKKKDTKLCCQGSHWRTRSCCFCCGAALGHWPASIGPLF
jgi:hypothetical protein